MLAVLLLGLVTAETAGIISSVVRQVDRVRLIDNSSSWDVHVVGTNKKLQEAFSSSYAVTSTVSEHSVVICIDFAQYVHPSLHGSFACDLVQARPRMVVFASATEGEGELRPPLHAKFVGEAKFSFWIDHFQRCNYSLDTVSTVRARNYAMAALGEEEDLWYFAKNVLFFYPALPVDSTDTYSAALRQVAKLEMASLMASIHHALSWFSTSESPGVPIAFQKLFEADGIAYRAIIQRAENKLYPNVYDEGRTYPKNDSLSILGAQETASMMLHLYTSRNFAELTKQLQRHLELLEAATVYDPQKLNTWVQLVLFLLSRHDFEVSDVESSLRILRYAGPLCHAIRLSGAASADATISTLSQGDNTVLKLLLLLTPYSKFELHAADMWPNYAILADVWLLHVLRLCAKGSLASLEFEIRVRKLVHELVQISVASEQRLEHWHVEFLWLISYIAPDVESVVKGFVHRNVQTGIQVHSPHLLEPDQPPSDAPGTQFRRRRILVVSGVWIPHHSVVRNFKAYVAALASEFQIELLFTTSNALTCADLDSEYFHAVKCHDSSLVNSLQATVQWIRSQRFDALFYPEVGMHPQIIILSNLRLSKVQVTSYGHSCSTHGSLIDYYVGGAEIELWDDFHPHIQVANGQGSINRQTLYSEQLLLIPGGPVSAGMGIIFEPMPYINRVSAHSASSSPTVGQAQDVVVNCAWTAAKINSGALQVLAQLMDQLFQRMPRTTIHVRFFASLPVNEWLAMEALQVEINRLLRSDLPETFKLKVSIQSALDPVRYLELLSTGTLALDAWPYGGCNTVVDSLYAGVPIVSRIGVHWRSRIGPGILARLGLDALIARSESEYIAIAVLLATNSSFRDHVRSSVAQLNFDAIMNTSEAIVYTRMFHSIIDTAEHPMKSKLPILFR